MQVMDISFEYPGSPVEVPGFAPDEDLLIIALNDALLEMTAPRLDLYHNRTADRLELSVSLEPGAPQLLIHLPGLSALRSEAVVLLSLSDSEALGPVADPGCPTTNAAALTGEGLYPPEEASRNGSSSEPSRLRFALHHDWRRDGPPSERFFDLSDPDSQLEISLPPTSYGPVHAIRFIETTATGDSTETHSSIVLVQSPPGNQPLSPAALTAKFATSLGTPDFRAIAWIWLGNEGHFTNPETREWQAFGRINKNPALSLTGPIAGSVEICR